MSTTDSRFTDMKTVREAKLDNLVLRLVEKDKHFIGVIIADRVRKVQIDGDTADDVWRRLHDEAGKTNPKYFGFDGARARFLHWFKDGFQSQRYLDLERGYKGAAKSKLDATVPIDEALNGSGYGERVLHVFRDTNLLSPFEKTRLQDVLRGPTADDFIRAAARFTTGDRKPALLQMERALKPHDSAKWTVVTYLPFLWRPDEHMFLKPEATKDFAARVGHRFHLEYEAALNLAVYESLLDLADKTTAELADLRPRDRIDVQSFIWVVGDYKEGSEQPDSRIEGGQPAVTLQSFLNKLPKKE
jgi:hypothetical protein